MEGEGGKDSRGVHIFFRGGYVRQKSWTDLHIFEQKWNLYIRPWVFHSLQNICIYELHFRNRIKIVMPFLILKIFTALSADT